MSETYDYTKILEVIEFKADNWENDVRVPNAYLKEGWVLLATYTEGDIRHGQSQVYCLGWPGPEIPRHPELPLSKRDESLQSYADQDERDS